ncbi:MAG: hypothetical protein HYU75_05780, partial [Betaproteobacteria bacterium]|nr:hypothetical protein [Betaproteobacteria bacterium]
SRSARKLHRQPASLDTQRDPFCAQELKAFVVADLTANLLDPGAVAAVIGATSVTVSDAVTVAQADALLALNANVIYPLFDTVANLTAPSALSAVAGADFVTPTDPATVAEAEALLALNPNTFYSLADTAGNLLAFGAEATVAGAQSVAVADPGITVGEADAILLLNSLATYSLSDAAANLLDPLEAAIVAGALSVTVPGDEILVFEAQTLLALNAQTSGFGLSDTAFNLTLDPALLGLAASLTVTDAASVAEAATILAAQPTTILSIADTSANVAAALSTGSPDLATLASATTIGVTDPSLTLTLDADQFGNLLAGSALLSAADTIAIDGAEVLADLGTLHFFGGDITLGMTLGGTNNGSYIVDMGGSGEASVVMAGLGQHQISAALGVLESFVMGATSLGGSAIGNLEAGDRFDVTGGGSTVLATDVGAAALVDADGEWAFDGAQLTWWDSDHASADVLTLQFAAGATGLLQETPQSFVVV